MTMKNIIFYIVLIALGSCKIQPVSITNIEWRLVELNGEDVSKINPPLTLSLDGAHKINGFAGCNRFFGSYELNESKIQFSGLGSTKMYCQEKSATEDKYLKALSEVESFLPKGGRLLLISKTVLLEFKK